MRKFSIILFLAMFFLCLFLTRISADSDELPTIVVDAGHGGTDGGAVINNIKEATLTLMMAKKLQEVLEANGYKVIMTRTEDRALCDGVFIKKEDMSKRVNIINQSKAVCAISIHMNQFSMEKYRGAQVFYSSVHKNNAFLAETLQRSIIISLKNTDRKIVKRDNIYLLNHVLIPCCIVECGFMSNYEELELLQNTEYQYKFVQSLQLGISNFLSFR